MLEKWSTTPGNNVNSNTGINWDEGQTPSSVNDSARDTLAALRDWYDAAEWPILGRNGSANAYSISFVSATVFKFAGTDRRTLVPVGRRVKAGVGAGAIYGTCTDVTLSASDTQATVSWDSGSLDSSLSYIALGSLSPLNSSHPVQRDSYPHFADATDPTRRARLDCGSISASTIRVLTINDNDCTLGKGPTIQVFAASGTYTPTAGMRLCKVTVIGGGGGAGGAKDSGGATGGGGAGGCSVKYVSAATVGASQAVTVGTGGAGGSGATGANGSAGNNSSFGAICSATGGALSTGSTGGTITNGGLGGIGSSGDLNFAGGAGNTGNAVQGGNGGNSFMGAGGLGVLDTTGNAGRAYGSGGSGVRCSASSSTGGAGSDGVVFVEEFF